MRPWRTLSTRMCLRLLPPRVPDKKHQQQAVKAQHLVRTAHPRRGTRAAILGEAGDEQQAQGDDMMMGFDRDASAFPAASGVGVGFGVVDGGGGGGAGNRRRAGIASRRGSSGTRRTDRIAKRMAEASAAGMSGWPSPHMPN